MHISLFVPEIGCKRISLENIVTNSELCYFAFPLRQPKTRKGSISLF